MKIGAFDSGIGGTAILEAVKERLPNEEYNYIADSKNCPYGEKAEDELYNIVKNNVNELKKWGAKIVVVACNTATVRCIDKLRDEFKDMIFVGTEPAVKVALSSGAQKILVLATPNTIESERMHLLADDNSGVQVDLKACPGLAETIEKYYRNDFGKIKEKLDELLVKDETYDAVVLGCTHYPLVKNEIQRFYKNAKMVDSSVGVAKQVEAIVKEIKDKNELEK